MYLCLAALSIGIFASCKAKKGVEATFSDLDGSWNIVELNGKVLNPAETNQVIEFDVARHSLSGRAGCNRMMGQIEYSDSRKNIIKFPQVATTRMACPDMSGERELLQALDKVVRFDAVGEVKPVNKIALYGTDNTWRRCNHSFHPYRTRLLPVCHYYSHTISYDTAPEPDCPDHILIRRRRPIKAGFLPTIMYFLFS